MKDNRRLGGSEDKYDFKTEARIKGKQIVRRRQRSGIEREGEGGRRT